MNQDSINPSVAHAADGDGEWQACPPGALTGLADRLRANDRRRQNVAIAKVAGAATVVTAMAVLAVGLMVGPTQLDTPMNCAECFANFDAYHLHLKDGDPIDATLNEKMQAHLAKCEACRMKFEQEYPGLLATIMDAVQNAYAAVVRSFTALVA